MARASSVGLARSELLRYVVVMLDLRFVCENLAAVGTALARRGFVESELLAAVDSLASKRRALLLQVEALRAERNQASEAMARLDKQTAAFGEQRQALRQLGDRIAELELQLRQCEGDLQERLLYLPNLPAESTPDGRSEADNRVVSTWGELPRLSGKVRDHVELGTALGIVDFESAAKLSGARFVVLRGLGARLERALMQWMLDLHTAEHGYIELWLPTLVKRSALRGTGQLPKFEADVFRIVGHGGDAAAVVASDRDPADNDLFLSPTAEVQITNLHADEILAAEDLPRAYTAYSACFRSEAGSYGRDTRGMIRQHQFDKVELVRLCPPDQGEAQLEILRQHAEAVLQRLGLHYRVVELCSGDIGFAARKTYDLEVWLPGQQAYREISSCSWCGDFQARRAQLRFRPSREVNGKEAKPQFLHTLNGSGLPIGRTVVAILEQMQQEDGSVRVPPCLVPYLGGVDVLR